MSGLQSFFKPASVAIVGASSDTYSISGRPLRLLREMKYDGRVYAVNPKYTSLLDFPCYKDIKDLPEVPETVMIAVNARLAVKVLDDCVSLGVKNAIVFSSGFAEAGNDETQRELDRIVSLKKVRVCGPNCQGMVNLFDDYPAGFSAALDEKDLHPGPAAFLSQSGALGFSTFNMAHEKGIGFGYVVTTGNQCDIEVTELAEHALADPRVNVVICYLEGIKDFERLKSASSAARQQGKPLCILKVGKSEAGQKAAQSHTAALAGSAAVFEAFARQEGIVLLNDISEVLDAAAVFGPGKKTAGKRVGILTSSGGAGILMADRCEELGLSVPELPCEAQHIIKRCIPAFGSARNPVDLTAAVMTEAGNFRMCLDAVLESPDIDMAAVIMTMIVGHSADEVAKHVREASEKTKKPVVVCWTIGPKTLPITVSLAKEGIPVFQSPASCARALAMLAEFSEATDRKTTDTAPPEPVDSFAIQRAREASRDGTPLTEHAAKQILGEYGIPVTKEAIAQSVEAAVSIARSIGYPVALKVSSKDIPHKTEAGGVRLSLSSDIDVSTAFEEIMANARRHNPGARIDGVLVQEMSRGGTEVIVGVNKDPQYGPTVMFGLGGIFVEVFKDVSFRLTPLGFEEALRMITDTRAYAILAGARGRPRADIEALAALLVKVSQFAHETKGFVKELDLNPVMVFPQGMGVKVIDALLIPDKVNREEM